MTVTEGAGDPRDAPREPLARGLAEGSWILGFLGGVGRLDARQQRGEGLSAAGESVGGGEEQCGAERLEGSLGPFRSKFGASEQLGCHQPKFADRCDVVRLRREDGRERRDPQLDTSFREFDRAAPDLDPEAQWTRLDGREIERSGSLEHQ